jgi:hypothetical protein
MPLETISGAGRTSRREAGTTAASLEIAPTWAKISAVFFVVFSAVFSAIESAITSTFERGADRKDDCGEKIKERPMAADEKIGEADILSRYRQLAIVRERRGQDQPGRGVAFAFYSPK